MRLLRRVILPLSLGLLLVLLPGCNSGSRRLTGDVAACRSNLWNIRFALERASWQSLHFPQTLEGVAGFEGDIHNYVCPATHHQPGSITNVSEWTDYIYVGGLTEAQDLRIAMIICPPKNHGGQYGQVAYIDRNIVETLPAEEINKLIKQPWLHATRLSPRALELVKDEANICVPPHDR